MRSIALYPGFHASVSMLQAIRNMCNIENWEEPGDEAKENMGCQLSISLPLPDTFNKVPDLESVEVSLVDYNI